MPCVSSVSARLLALLSRLQGGRSVGGAELAASLGVTRRTVRRDIERLRTMGYPVQAARGAEGGYRLAAGAAMPPLVLDDDEAVAMAVGMRAAGSQPVEGIEDASLRALAKLEQVLPSRLRPRVAALAVAPGAPARDATVDPELLATLASGVARRERLLLRYRSSDAAPSRRTVEPERVVSVHRRWYLVAFDVDRDDWRTFRADRIESARPTSVPSRRRAPLADPVAFVTERLYALAPTHAAVLTMDASVDEARRGLGALVDTSEPLGAGRCRVRTRPDTVEWLARRLVALEHDFDVHEPPELIERLAEIAARLARAVRGSPAPARLPPLQDDRG
jgi:predicted DNA-binding transcriptional regulator YafY